MKCLSALTDARRAKTWKNSAFVIARGLHPLMMIGDGEGSLRSISFHLIRWAIRLSQTTPAIWVNERIEADILGHSASTVDQA